MISVRDAESRKKYKTMTWRVFTALLITVYVTFWRGMTESTLLEENKRLKQQMQKLCAALIYWREEALYFQAERDHYREQSLEGERDAF